MPLWIITLIQLIVMYFLSRWLNGSLFQLFARLTRSHHLSVTFTTLLLFPGTVVHELSHLFIAEILGVRTGRLNLFPKVHDEHVIEAGSVEVAKTDPLRRSLIGIAPLIIGIITITLLSSYIGQLYPGVLAFVHQPDILRQPLLYGFTFLGYLLFAISNNMFPSSVDMKGVPAVLIVVLLILSSAYAVGLRFALSGQALDIYTQIMTALVTNLTVVMVLNVVLLIGLRILLYIRK